MTIKPEPATEASGRGASLETTASLLARVRAGDAAARDTLLRRYLPMMRRWAHGRLPRKARDLADTDDLVQITLIRALDHVGAFEPRHEGAFLAWLRRIFFNQIRDELRRVSRRPMLEEISSAQVAADPSPLQRAIGLESLARYEKGLARLTEKQQEAIIIRVELGLSYAEMRDAMDLASVDAARMLVSRALVRLAEAMDEPG